MSAQLKPDPQSESDRLDMAADQVIAMAGGDMRGAVRTLILANEFLEYEVCELMKMVSNGYTRVEYQRDIPTGDPLDDPSALPTDQGDWHD